jgi:hypothetical protein
MIIPPDAKYRRHSSASLIVWSEELSQAASRSSATRSPNEYNSFKNNLTEKYGKYGGHFSYILRSANIIGTFGRCFSLSFSSYI